MDHQAHRVWQPAAASASAWAFQAEGKVDNRAYAAATRGFWAEVSRCEPAPALDAKAVPEQPMSATPAADYANLFA